MTSQQPHVPPSAVTLPQSNDTNNPTVTVSDGYFFADINCYRCQSMGNYAVNFPPSMSSTHVGSKYLQVGMIMAQTMNDTP